MLLFEDETILRLFPVLRRAWSLRGEQAIVPITGGNAKRVLFGTINPRTGHRIVLCRPNRRQEHFQAFLRLLRQSFRAERFGCCSMKHLCPIAPKSQTLAEDLNIVLIWLLKQGSKLNAMGQLWRELKDNISANYQFKDIEEHAAMAEHWILSLSKSEALVKAGVLSKNFWLQSLYSFTG